MKKLVVLVDWCEKNYSALINENVDGIILATAKSLKELEVRLKESIELHILDSECEVSDFLRKGEYELEYQYTISATLQKALNYTTLAAISRVTGIKHAQLSHYANAVSRPLPRQQERIINGLHEIGRVCLSVQ